MIKGVQSPDPQKLLRIVSTGRWMILVSVALSCFGILIAEGHLSSDWTSIRDNLFAVIVLGLLVILPLARIAWIWQRRDA